MGSNLLSIAQDWVLLNWQEIMRCFLLEVRTNGVTADCILYGCNLNRVCALGFKRHCSCSISFKL